MGQAPFQQDYSNRVSFAPANHSLQYQVGCLTALHGPANYATVIQINHDG